MLLDAAFALAWCSRYEPWERRRSTDRLGVWAVRALIPLGQLTIARRHGRHRLRARTPAPTPASSSTASPSRATKRWNGWSQRHAAIATVFGLAAIAVWFLLRRPGGDRRAAEAADGGSRPARPAGRRRRPPVGAEAAGGDRLGPRRARHRQLAGDAVDRRRRRRLEPRGEPLAAERERGRGAGRRPPPRPSAPLLALDRRPQPRPGGAGRRAAAGPRPLWPACAAAGGRWRRRSRSGW